MEYSYVEVKFNILPSDPKCFILKHFYNKLQLLSAVLCMIQIKSAILQFFLMSWSPGHKIQCDLYLNNMDGALWETEDSHSVMENASDQEILIRVSKSNIQDAMHNVVCDRLL